MESLILPVFLGIDDPLPIDVWRRRRVHIQDNASAPASLLYIPFYDMCCYFWVPNPSNCSVYADSSIYSKSISCSTQLFATTHSNVGIIASFHRHWFLTNWTDGHTELKLNMSKHWSLVKPQSKYLPNIHAWVIEARTIMRFQFKVILTNIKNEFLLWFLLLESNIPKYLFTVYTSIR